MTFKTASILTLSLCLQLGVATAEKVRVSSDTAPAKLLERVQSELHDETAPETEFEARRQARQAAERIENFLNSEAYFAPEISYAVEPGEAPVPLVRVEPEIGRASCRERV